MKKLDPLNDFASLLWLASRTLYTYPDVDKEKNINAGILIYNAATENTANDPGEEAALEAERQKLANALDEKPRNYTTAEQVTARWAGLIPAIHDFYKARRDFVTRPEGPNKEEEKQATELAKATTVPAGSEAGVFLAAKVDLDRVIGEHEKAQIESATTQIDQCLEFFQKTKYLNGLKESAASTDRATSTEAHHRIAECAAMLEDGRLAKDTLATYKSKKNELPKTILSILDPLLPAEPIPITSQAKIGEERQRIGKAKTFKLAYDAALRYSAARAAIEVLEKNPVPASLQPRHKEATKPPEGVKDLTDLAVLLEALQPLWQPAAAFEKALIDAQGKLDKFARVQPDASSESGLKFKQKIEKAISAAKQFASQDKFTDASGALADIANDLNNRGKDLVLAVSQRHAEANHALTDHDDMDDSAIKDLLAKLRRKLPSKIDDKTDLAKVSGDIEPALLLGRLIPAATRYTQALETAEANWKVLGVPGFAPAYKLATTPIVLPEDPAKLTPEHFEVPAKRLEDFNTKWITGKALDEMRRNLEKRLLRLEDTRPEGGEAYKKKESEIRRALNAAKLIVGPDKLGAAEKDFRAVGLSITQELNTRVDLAQKEMDNLPLEAGPQAILKGISAAKDRNGNPLGVALYLEFGKDLPKLLAAFDTVPHDNDHGKAAKNLAALGQHLGAGTLQQLASDLFEDDAAKLGTLMAGILQKGLATGAPDTDNDKRLDNLKSLADAFGDTGKLSTLLKGLARGDADKAAERMDALLMRFFNGDPKKLKTPFFDELEKGPSATAYLIRQAATFGREDDPAENELELDRAELRGARLLPKGGKHLINRHTRAHCAFTEENVGLTAKNATFWPEGTTNENVQAYLKAAVAAINPMPNAGGLGNPQYGSGDFVQRDVSIQVSGKAVTVRVGFEFYNPGRQMKITQFYPKSGAGLVTLSPGELRAIGKAIPK